MKTLISRVSVLAALSATLVLGQNPPPSAAPAPLSPAPAPALGTSAPVAAPLLPAVQPPILPESTNATPDAGLLGPSGAGVGAAGEVKPAKPAKPAAPKLPGVGVRGSVTAVDAKALTFSVEGKGQSKDHVVHITSSSRYTHDGKPATVSDVVVGDVFNGRVKKNKQGEEVLLTGTFTAPGAAKAPASKGAGKAKSKAKAKAEPKDAGAEPAKDPAAPTVPTHP